MGQISRQLTVNITVTNTWCQLLNGAGGAAYAVPSSGSNPRADVRLIRALNLSSGSSRIDLAFSSGSPPSDAAMTWYGRYLRNGGYLEDDSVQVVHAGEKVWARVRDQQSGSPNVTVRVSLLEMS